jgi:hypothetical protein
MAEDIVSGLFGLSPYQVEQQQRSKLDTDAYKYAQMTAAQRGIMDMYKGAAGLTGTIGGMMGYENRDVAEARNRQSSLSGMDLSSPESILASAEKIQDPQLKMRLQMLAQQKMAERQKSMADAQKMKLDEARAARELALAEKAARGEPDMKYAPEVQKLLMIREQLPEGDPRIPAIDAAIRKATYVKPEGATGSGGSSKPKGLSREAGLKWELENGFITQEIYDQAMGATPGGKVAAKEEQRKNAYDGIKAKVDLTSGAVDTALKETGFFTTGMTGKMLSAIPGTSAFDLEGTVNTILANLGFSELQAMRNASPTGGALGQVAVRELEMLQSTIASLRMGQSKDKQLQSLATIKKHLDGWKSAIEKANSQPEKGGKWEAKTPDEVKALFKSGTISREEAKAILKDMGV